MAVHPLPSEVRRLWRAIALGLGLLVGAIGLLGIIGLAVTTDESPIGLPTVGFGVVLLALLVAAVGWQLASWRYNSWRFDLTDEWIFACWGVIGHHSATIPRNRVQTLTSENGPLDRFLGLTSVTVHTAGAGAPNLSIPHLEDATVEWLRAELGRGVSD